MLRMSKLADYGTVILTTMANRPEVVQSAASIAAAIHVPATTVSKILKMLAHAGLLTSTRGANGGYLLSQPPAKITVAQIINAMDGPIGMTECSITPGLCSHEKNCTVRANWQRVNRVVLHALEQITLEDMIQPVAEPVSFNALKTKQPAVAGAIGVRDHG